MIRISQIMMGLKYTEKDLAVAVCSRLHISDTAISSIKLHKRSVDARKKSNVHFLCSVDVAVVGDEEKILAKSAAKNAIIVKDVPYSFVKTSATGKKVVVVGSGPAGLFCAYILARAGLSPLIIERGDTVENRIADIEKFQSSRILNEESNVQFGEGGAGTFSDGKLNTGIKDARIKTVLDLFVQFGAADEIKWQAKPHIGTDVLRLVIVNMRKQIMQLGGSFLFNTKLTDIVTHGGKICSAVVKNGESSREIECDDIVLAIGHSARDTFKMLQKSGMDMIAKPFAVGVRIEHLQSEIDKMQYGSFAEKGILSAADYKAAVHLPNGRGVYTFCMCPGGYVMAAASEKNMVATNGMSNFARDGKNGNSAVLVGVNVDDFGSDDALAGIEFQRKIERAAFVKAGESYNAPAQTLGSFLYGKENSIGEIYPTYRPDVTMCDIRAVFPQFITDSLKTGIRMIDRTLHGFASKNAIITAPETRSSSPVRLIRKDDMQSNICGIYPCGEGAGYAGGITSAAVDGIKAAENILVKYNQN